MPTKAPAGPSLVDESLRAIGGYYGRLGRIGADLACALLPDALREAAERLPVRLDPRRTSARVTSSTGSPAAGGRGDIADPGSEPTLRIEADGDRPGFGVFLVENLTAQPVTAPIGVSVFVGEQGHEVRPRVVLRPATVNLGPGEHTIVQLAAELDEALEAGITYRGEIAIPALSDRRIPVVLRRRPAEAMPPEATPAPAEKAGAKAAAKAGTKDGARTARTTRRPTSARTDETR